MYNPFQYFSQIVWTALAFICSYFSSDNIACLASIIINGPLSSVIPWLPTTSRWGSTWRTELANPFQHSGMDWFQSMSITPVLLVSTSSCCAGPVQIIIICPFWNHFSFLHVNYGCVTAWYMVIQQMLDCFMHFRWICSRDFTPSKTCGCGSMCLCCYCNDTVNKIPPSSKKRPQPPCSFLQQPH